MKKSYLVIPITIITLVVIGVALSSLQKIKSDGGTNSNSINQNTTQQNTAETASNTQAQADNIGAPNDIPLTISSPQSGTTVSLDSVIVRGKTVPYAEVLINEIDFKADASGNFSSTVFLDEGENTIFITAIDGNGNASEKEITVTNTLQTQ